MRSTTHERRAFIASLNPWRAPAGRILDCFRLLATLPVHESPDTLRIRNGGSAPAHGVTLVAPHPDALLQHGAAVLAPRGDGRLVIGDLPAGSEMRFVKPGRFG